MFKRIGSYFLVSLVGLFLILLLTWIVLDYYLPAPPKVIKATIGLKNGSNESFAKQYQTILARSGITFEYHFSSGTGENLERLSDPQSDYQFGFASDRAIEGYQTKDLMSLGRIAYQPYWIFYRSNKEWADLDSLKGKRLAVGAQTTGRYRIAQALHLVGNTPTDYEALSGEDAVKALKEERVDAILTTGAFNAPLVQALLLDPSVRVLNFPRAEALTKIFPQLRHLVLPAGIVDFEKNIPPRDIHIIATSTSALVRKDLHPQIIYLLVQALEEVHGGFGPFQAEGTFPTQFDAGYPMSSVARDYYKNGPSFLYRYLPFSITNYIHRLLAILATILGIVLPLVKIVPKLYNWFIEQYTDKLFRRLRILHVDVEQTRDVLVLKEMEQELNSIDQAVHLLPMRNTNIYFSLIGRIDNERKLLVKQLAL